MEGNYFNCNILALTKTNNSLVSKLNCANPQIKKYQYISSKTGDLIPCTQGENPRALHSKIDPIREGNRFLSLYKNRGFLIFLGMGAAYQIRPFIDKNQFSNILIIDKDLDRFKDIISKLDLKDIFLNPAIKILIDPTPQELFNFILENYIPAISGDVTTIPLRQRVNSEIDFFTKTIDIIKGALNRISDDYTVQTRFGKKWFSNTLFNIKEANKSKPMLKPIKSAIITAAGPSLEDSIEEIRERQKNATLIATDTTAPALLAHNIKPDIIISIDCQHISYYHFIKSIPKDIPLVLDITSPRKLTAMFDTVYFFTSGHPIGQYINKKYKTFPTLNTSGGSVTHAALSLADALNAKNIYLYGADFSYPQGKSYARGTYIYDYFNKTDSRTSSLESSFFSFIMDSRDISIEQINDGLRYITKPMIGYKENLEKSCETLRGKLHVKQGRGCKINIDQNDPTCLLYYLFLLKVRLKRAVLIFY
ncbi:DUF115 domain-containing protein [Thiospirochaeta perfilievii]|uniref:DUF115 domain-containing protein n=1 Tax=Thiospirochaeta perfilievii TaxID=252967 RepID=A0A5C1Q9W6_9SPIO|nr:6-hydroxymethylpterin diphosphokinase MptE-like protein [Thiospirochaeta perfilievii]QEN04271.1 DUF115 domain-containing protein [Thiospirochaeta perfilievii]